MTKEQLENIFTYHSPEGTQNDRYVQLREKAKELASMVNNLCPESREKSLAITSIQQSTMWANASIAINENPVKELLEGIKPRVS
jgi:hypothetical protein